MGTQKDILNTPQAPDRVFYANGVLLDQEDFTTEQTYHRGRMGRALAYLQGSGTVAGLNVEVKAADGEEKVIINPGLAIDRLGRMIEVPRSACLRLTNWFEDQASDPKGMDRLANSFRPFPVSEGSPPVTGIVADVFIKFEVCERGKQPAFATGNFDALDALAPSRLRDGYHLELLIREETPLTVPDSGFPNLSGIPLDEVKQKIVQYKLQEAWKESTAWTGPGDTLLLLPEHVQDGQQDGTELLMARLWVPTTDPASDPPIRRSSEPVYVDNTLRRFVYSTAELAAMVCRLIER